MSDPEHFNDLMRTIDLLTTAALPESYGYTLLIFGFNNSDLFYASNGDRDDVIRTMEQLIQRFREDGARPDHT